MKVVFLTSIPIIKQHRFDMQIDAISDFYETEIWDLSALYNQNEVMYEKDNSCKSVFSLDQLRCLLLEELKVTKIVVVTNILLIGLKKIYPVIHEMKIPIININKDSIAQWLIDISTLRNFSHIRIRSVIRALIRRNTITRKVYNFYLNGFVKYDYQLASYNFFPEESKKFIKIHNVKYDEFLDAQNHLNIVGSDYILFIDAALADHPMFMKSANRLDKASYLKQLNSYFQLIEKKYKIKVIISAHPKSNYSENDFEGRKIFLYKTPILIRHAKYIVTHYSTSLFDVILQKKPFKVLYSKELLDAACSITVRSGIQVAKLVDVDCVNLDNPTFDDFRVSDSAYEAFKLKYLVNSDKMGIHNKELILQFLSQLEV